MFALSLPPNINDTKPNWPLSLIVLPKVASVKKTSFAVSRKRGKYFKPVSGVAFRWFITFHIVLYSYLVDFSELGATSGTGAQILGR